MYRIHSSINNNNNNNNKLIDLIYLNNDKN